MAKKHRTKGSGNQRQKPMTEKRYFLERVSALPIYRCYLTPHWHDDNIGVAIVTRKMANGNVAYASFLIDTGCLGVKNSIYMYNQSEDDLREYMDNLDIEFEETPYSIVHNFILGAVEYAENLGIDPDKDFYVAENILEEDSDDIELINFDFGGEDGKPLLVIGPTGKERKYIDLLRKRLGDESFTVIAPEEDVMSEEEYSHEIEQWILSEEYRKDSTLNQEETEYYDAIGELIRARIVSIHGLENEFDESILSDILLDPDHPRHNEILQATADRSFLHSDHYNNGEKLDLWLITRHMGFDPLEPSDLEQAIDSIRQKEINSDDSEIR